MEVAYNQPILGYTLRPSPNIGNHIGGKEEAIIPVLEGAK
jgi:hypothetical protein